MGVFLHEEFGKCVVVLALKGVEERGRDELLYLPA
jgi:hypothetical protein